MNDNGFSTKTVAAWAIIISTAALVVSFVAVIFAVR